MKNPRGTKLSKGNKAVIWGIVSGQLVLLGLALLFIAQDWAGWVPAIMLALVSSLAAFIPMLEPRANAERNCSQAPQR